MNPAMQYLITHTYFHHNYKVSTPDKQHLFHVVNSSFRPRKPDLTFHQGPDSHGPIAGICKFRHFSSDCEAGLGSPDQPSKVDWVHLHKHDKMRQWWFRMKMDESKKKKTFTWKRVHLRNTWKHELVEESTQNVVAILSPSEVFKKTDQMDIFSDFGPHFNLSVLISGLAVLEKVRRLEASDSGAPGGGGC
ncbi:hypothetical protein N7475_008917 [Penicillium sp. IBT 31633x]|nr:hypothetical protein N7475_008917 [Penicillium sp. IBT 31633x]